MVDFASARRAMVDSQLLTGGVSDRRLLAAMGRIPREMFVAPERRQLAYIDDEQDVGAPSRRLLRAPVLFARLAQTASVKPGDHVLDLGILSGYSTAIFALLGERVTGVEPEAALLAAAVSNLAQLDIANVELVGAEVAGLGDRQFDVIHLAEILDRKPEHLSAHLRPGGRLVFLLRHGAVGIGMSGAAEPGGTVWTAHFEVALPPVGMASTVEEFVF